MSPRIPRPRQLHFNVHVTSGGNHEAAWRHPRSTPVRLATLDYHRQIAAIAERSGVPLDTVLDLQDTLIRHTRAIAEAYVEHLFLAMAQAFTAAQRAGHETGGKDTGAAAPPHIDPALVAGLKALFERLRPLAIGSISAAFPVVLQQEFDRSLQKQLK